MTALRSVDQIHCLGRMIWTDEPLGIVFGQLPSLSLADKRAIVAIASSIGAVAIVLAMLFSGLPK